MMRTRLHAAALAAILFAALPSAAVAATDLRVGYIDSGRIFTEYKNAVEAQQRFDRQVQGWRDDAGEKQNLVKKLRTEAHAPFCGLILRPFSRRWRR